MVCKATEVQCFIKMQAVISIISSDQHYASSDDFFLNLSGKTSTVFISVLW